MKNYFFLTIIVLCVIRVLDTGMVIATPCSNYASNYSIEVATFCANSHASGNLIAIDGYYANTISDTVCSCVVTSNKIQTFTLRSPTVSNFIPEVSSSQCGSIVSVTHSDGVFKLQCSHYGSTNVTENEIITLVLTKDTESKDTRYCLILGQETASFDVSCSSQSESTLMPGEITTISGSTTIETQEQTEEETSESSQGTASIDVSYSSQNISTLVPGEITMISITTTTETQTDEETSVSSKMFTTLTTEVKIGLSSTTVTSSEKETVRLTHVEDDHKLYIGIGAGCGAVLIVLLVLMIIIYRRRKENTKYEEHAPSSLQNQDNDEEGLKYNVLYMPSTINETGNITTDGKRISYDIEETCHTVDGDDTQTSSKKNDSVKSPVNAKQSLKPNIAPKPKTVCVKHVIAPGESGSEYAIVHKTGNNQGPATESSIEAYTVVNKTGRQSNNEQTASDACLTDNTYAVVNKNKNDSPYKNGTEENKCLSRSRDNEKLNETYAKNDKRNPTGDKGVTDEFVVSKENSSKGSILGRQNETNSSSLGDENERIMLSKREIGITEHSLQNADVQHHDRQNNISRSGNDHKFHEFGGYAEIFHE